MRIEARVQVHEQPLSQKRRDNLREQNHNHTHSQHGHDIDLFIRQHLVDQELREQGENQANSLQEERGPQHLKQCEGGLPDVLGEVAAYRYSAVRSLGLKAHSWFEHNDHAGKARVELLTREAATAPRRIDHVHMFWRPALDDQEVIELPMDDRGQGDEAQIVLLQRNRPHAQIISAGRLHNTERRETVAPDLAMRADLRNRRFASIVAQNHCQTGGPTFNHSHLVERWNASSPGTTFARALAGSGGPTFHFCLYHLLWYRRLKFPIL